MKQFAICLMLTGIILVGLQTGYTVALSRADGISKVTFSVQ
jgi:hypothetical protein